MKIDSVPKLIKLNIINLIRDEVSEEILGIFPAFVPEGRQRGFTMPKGWYCKLFFTTERLIVTPEDKPGFKIFLSKSRWKDATRQRLFNLEPYYIYSRVSMRDRLKMKKTSAESILKANGRNFEISYSDITLAEINSSTKSLNIFTKDLDTPEYEFAIATTTANKARPYLIEFGEFLRTVLPDKADVTA